jgi:HK97 family phage portal protein
MSTRADVTRLLGSHRFRGAAQITSLAGRGQRLTSRELAVLGVIDTSGAIPDRGPASEAEAMGLPPFGRAVALLANAIASTSWYARRADPVTGVYDRLQDQPSIVTDPYPLSTAWHYKWGVAEDAILYGNHFALPGDRDWRTGRPGWLVPIAADEVWIMTDPARPGWYSWVIGGVSFPAEDIFHIPFGNRSGEVLGRGVLAQYGDWLGGAVAAEDYSRDVFAAGALPPAVILTNQASTQAQADDLKLKWRELVSTREPVIFPNGTELRPIVGNAQQSQLVEARTWNAQMIADVVGVPGWKLGLAGPTMTYQNIETADIDFVRDSVDRFGQPFSQSISKWLLPGGTELVWDYASRMRADSKATADVLTAYVAAGIITIDEARASLNRPPLGAPEAPQAADTTNTGNQDAQVAATAAQAALDAAPAALQITSGTES